MEEATTPKRLITKHDFYFETPLYEVIKLDELPEDILSGDIDAYNPIRLFDTTYKIESKAMGESWSHYSNFLRVTLTCKRDADTFLTFILFLGEDHVVKIGQNPSLADIQFSEISKKYDKVLDTAELKEFKRAIGLVSYGVGVGSYVYLRRIFENLIKQAYNENSTKITTSEIDFQKLRMEEKVEVLKAYLPSQLVEMKTIYKILSKGIHELSDQECLKHFQPLKLAIELILEQNIETETRKRRDADVKKQIELLLK